MEFSSQVLLSEPTYRLVFQQQISSKQAAGAQTCTCFCLGPSGHAADFQQLPGAKRIPVCTEARRHPEKGECKGSPGTPCVQYESKGKSVPTALHSHLGDRSRNSTLRNEQHSCSVHKSSNSSIQRLKKKYRYNWWLWGKTSKAQKT